MLASILIQPAQTSSPDAEGFIRNWLVLAPIAVQEDSGATEIEKDFLGGESSIRPKPGDKVNVNGKILTWTPHQTLGLFHRLPESIRRERGEDVAGYAVAYINADDEMKVRLSVGSNDQCKVWVNGKLIVKFTETRTLDKDTDSGDVTLVEGTERPGVQSDQRKEQLAGCGALSPERRAGQEHYDRHRAEIAINRTANREPANREP